MPFPTPSRLAAPAIVAFGAVVCLWLTGWFGLNLRDPLSFYGDHMLWLGYARSFIEGHGFRFSDSLGFPGVRDHMYNPTFYLSQKSLMWLAARAFDNPAAVISVFYGVGITCTYGACYWALRQVSIDRWLSVIGSVAFVVTPFFAFRAGNHDPFAVYYSVPLGAMLALRLGMPDAGRARPTLRARVSDPAAWLLVFLVSASGVYFAFFTAVFITFVGGVTAIARRTVEPAGRAVLWCAGIVVGLLVTGPGLGILDVLNGAVQVPGRSAMEQSLYGLSVGDAVRPLARLPFTPAWWANGIAGMSLEGTFGEWPGLLLTLVILVSPVIALGAAMAGPTSDDDRRRWLVALCAGCAAFGVFVAARGGLGLLFSQVVTASLRAQSRIMPFLTFFAIVIILVWVQRALAAPHRGVRIVAPGLLVAGLLASVAESTPRFPLSTMQRAFLTSEVQQQNRRSILDMLERLRASGAKAVLQLPVVSWPEVPPYRGFTPYHFELPHVLDTARSGVRWSYGMNAAQPMFAVLASTVDTHREGGIAAAASSLGFDAIVIEKGAQPEAALTAWVTAIEADVPPRCRLFDDERRALYVLAGEGDGGTCAPPGPMAPLTTMRYITAEGRFGRSLLIGGGWSAAEGGYTWTDGERALVKVPVPPAARQHGAVEVRFDFGMFRHDPQKVKRVIFQAGGHEVHRIEVAAGEPPPESVTLTVNADSVRSDGSIEIVILTPDAESPADYGAADPRRLGLALREFHVRAMP